MVILNVHCLYYVDSEQFPLGDGQYFELLAVLLGWLCDDQLGKTGSPTHLVTSNCTKVNNKEK